MQAQSVPRWMRVLLVVSLAFNLSVAGLLIGDILTEGGPGGHPRPVDLGLDPMARALDDEDRSAILQSLRSHPDVGLVGRDNQHAAFAVVVDALMAEPFDEDRARSALREQSERVALAHSAVQDAFVERMAAMTSAERAAFATRLEAEISREQEGRARH